MLILKKTNDKKVFAILVPIRLLIIFLGVKIWSLGTDFAYFWMGQYSQLSDYWAYLLNTLVISPSDSTVIPVLIVIITWTIYILTYIQFIFIVPQGLIFTDLGKRFGKSIFYIGLIAVLVITLPSVWLLTRISLSIIGW